VNSAKPLGKYLGSVDKYGNPNTSCEYFAKGDCDEKFLDLIEELGWTDDLWAKRELLPEKKRALLASKML
jgi:hypothetical protein